MAAAVLVLAGGGCTGAGGTTPAGPRASAPGKVVADCLLRGACYAPPQFRVAYGFRSLLGRGIDGRGQTVLLLESAQSPASPDARQPAGEPPLVTDIRGDLAVFDRESGLPAARLLADNIAQSATPWLASGEEVEDTEIVHALAPDAVIREILVPPAALASARIAAW